MTSRQSCPGCSRPIAAAAVWCVACDRRLPAKLRDQVVHADRALRAAHAAVIGWLGQHPHATGRELEILALAAQGRCNTEIAAELHITVNTVRDAWKNLTKRWGCRGQAHAVATAFQLGYLKLETREPAA